jgi:hypothetical protein
VYRIPPTWHLFPVDIPVERRGRCDVAGCDEPVEVVEVSASLRGEVAPAVPPLTTTYCLSHGHAAGYQQPSRVVPPEHLSAFHRLLCHAADSETVPPQS